MRSDCTQPISGLAGLPGGLPWLPFTVRPVSTGVSNTCAENWTSGGTLCSVMSPVSACGTLIIGWSVEKTWGTLWWLLHWWSNILWWRQCDGVGRHHLHWKNQACHHWRQSQCREISRINSATSGSPISPQWLPPESGSGEDGVTCQQSWPQPHWILVASARACCSCRSDQHNYVGWFATNAG